MGFVESILERVQLLHLNILFLLGIALFGGIIGGRLFQKMKIPQVVGYIIIGLCLGESGLGIVSQEIITRLQPFNYFALGIIGFMVGGELKAQVFRKYGKQMMTILFCEGIAPFIFVSLLIGLGGGILFHDFRLSFSLGLLFGAIASATDPATTTEVLREYKTRGPLTRTIFSIVALDDGLALLLFVISSSVAGVLIGSNNEGLLKAFIVPFYEIFGAVLIGIFNAAILTKVLRKYKEEGRLLAFSIGTVLFVCGLALAIHVDMLLAAMTLGVVVTNFTPRKSKDVFKLVEGVTPPIFVLFFVLVGAKLNLRHMAPVTFFLVGLYLLGTASGKVFGSRFGAVISRSPKSVKKYLAYSMFPQAGIAIGLSILAAQYFPGNIGNIMVIVITATTFISQVVGPPLTKFSLNKAKEVGLNITEDDLVDTTKVSEAMDANPPVLFNDMHFSDILSIFSKTNNLYYPVVDRDKKLLGIITVDSIRNIFMESGLNDLLLAVDLMETARISAEADSSLATLQDLFNSYNLECIPIVDSQKILKGFIEKRMLNRFISTKILELQRQADVLESI